MKMKSKNSDVCWIDRGGSRDPGPLSSVAALHAAWRKNSKAPWQGCGQGGVSCLVLPGGNARDANSILADVDALRAAWNKGDEASLRPVIEALKQSAPPVPVKRRKLTPAGPKK